MFKCLNILPIYNIYIYIYIKCKRGLILFQFMQSVVNKVNKKEAPPNILWGQVF